MDKNIDEEKLSEKNYNFNLDYKLNKSKNIKKIYLGIHLLHLILIKV